MVEANTGIAAIGLDAQAFLFQVINFGILLFLLARFAYRPILKVLEERRQVIEESLRNAQEITGQKQQLEVEKQAILRAASGRAQEIIGQSEERADGIIQQAEEAALRQADDVLQRAEAQIKQEVSVVKGQIRREAIGLVALATERIIKQKMDSQKDQALIREALKL